MNDFFLILKKLHIIPIRIEAPLYDTLKKLTFSHPNLEKLNKRPFSQSGSKHVSQNQFWLLKV